MKLPQTPEEAIKTRYNQWAGNPKGTPYNPRQCAAGVWTGGRGSMEHQCSKKPGKGPHGLYCSIHATLCAGQETQTWYRANGSTIEEVQVSRGSDRFIWVNGHRREQHGPWGHHFPTREQCREFMIERAEQNVLNGLSSLEAARNVLEKVRKL